MEVCSFEVSIFSVRGGVVYIILQEDDIWPGFLHKKQVMMSSLMNIRYEVLSRAITIEPGSFGKSSGLMYSCLRKLVICANLSSGKPALSVVIEDVILTPNDSIASMIDLFGIAGYTCDKIMRLAGLISLRIGTSMLSMNMAECLLMMSLVICWFLRKTQNLLLGMREAEIMLVASVISLSAIMYCICLIPSIEFITIAWFIFGMRELAVVSAKLLTWELFVG